MAITKSRALFRGTIPLVISIILVLLTGFLFSNLLHAYDSSKDVRMNLDKDPNTSDQKKIETNTFQFPNTFRESARHMSGPVWLTLTDQDPAMNLEDLIKNRVAGAEDFTGNGENNRTTPSIPPNSPSSQGVGGGLVPFRDPAPAFSRNLLITRDFGTPLQTEPHIAVNPNDPDHLVMSTVDYSFPSNTSYVSIDGGERWSGPFQNRYVRDDLGAAGDPVVAFDRDGNVYSIGISIGFEEFTIGPFVAFMDVSSIYLTKSEDGGFNWKEPVDTARSGIPPPVLVLDEDGLPRGEVKISFLDKPWLAIGPNPSNPEKDNLYITYTDFEQITQIFYVGEQPILGAPRLQTTIRSVHSEDGGLTWSEPINVSPTVYLEYGERASESGESGAAKRRIVQGAQPVVGKDGTVYVAWLDTTDDDSQMGLGEIYVARSINGGNSFQDPSLASIFKEPNFSPRTANFRYWGSVFPQIAVGTDDEIYVAYVALPPDKPLDDGDVYVVASLDGGAKWQRPRRINGDDTNRLQFFPSITTSPNGDLHLMWGDMRDDPSETRYHIYYSTSSDQGNTWGFEIPELNLKTLDTRVTDFPSNANKGFPNGQFIGDYFSIAASTDDVYMVWADTRLGEYGPINQKIGFTRKRPIQSPEVFISPPAGPGGESITIQGFNFQPDMTYFVRVGGVTVQSALTDLKGQMTTEIFVPISGEGSHNIDVFDNSGNFATASFFMEFGFDNIRQKQDQMLAQLGAPQATPGPYADDLSKQDTMTPDSENNTSNTRITSDMFLFGSVGMLVGSVITILVYVMRKRRQVLLNSD